MVEAIESGIVKIPWVLLDDDAVSVDVKYLNLWPNVAYLRLALSALIKEPHR